VLKAAGKECEWCKGVVEGFSLHETVCMPGGDLMGYPFACRGWPTGGLVEGSGCLELPGGEEPLNKDRSGGWPLRVHGTLLTFPGKSGAFDAAIETCNRIEGYDPARPKEGLYQRAEVDVQVSAEFSSPAGTKVVSVVKAFMYFQDVEAGAAFKDYPNGDWLAGRSPP
jgi:hypothetical protein